MKSAVTFIALFLVASSFVNAQMFESQCSKYAGKSVVKKLIKYNSTGQLQIRDSIIGSRSDSVETYFDGETMGLIVYKNNAPWELLGFWDKEGKSIPGGELKEGSGNILTPLPSHKKGVFQTEFVPYIDGVKIGICFYFCDCKLIFARGEYDKNKKKGDWVHYDSSGAVIPKKGKIKGDKIKIDKDIRNVGHCMMRT